jgi:endonuclease YncB( thermonuclease family)
LAARLNPDGTISGGGRSVRLHGIAGLEPDRICKTPAGERWACGRRAFVALYNLVNQRRVACELTDKSAPVPVGSCWLDQIEISDWLLRNGFAEVAPDNAKPELSAAQTAAQGARLGIWADRPPGARP